MVRRKKYVFCNFELESEKKEEEKNSFKNIWILFVLDQAIVCIIKKFQLFLDKVKLYLILKSSLLTRYFSGPLSVQHTLHTFYNTQKHICYKDITSLYRTSIGFLKKIKWN